MGQQKKASDLTIGARPNKATKISVPETAQIMGVNPQFLRLGLQHGKYPFGVAVKMKRWAYYKNAERFIYYMQGFEDI